MTASKWIVFKFEANDDKLDNMDGFADGAVLRYLN